MGVADTRDYPILNVRQAAALFGRTEDTIRRWAKNGVLPCFQPLPGSPLMFRQSVIEKLLEGRTAAPKGDTSDESKTDHPGSE